MSDFMDIKKQLDCKFADGNKCVKYEIIVYKYDKVELLDNTTNVNFDLDYTYEIHAFNEEKEIRYIMNGNKLDCYEDNVKNYANCKVIEEKMVINPNILGGAILTVKNFLDYTEDGIIYVKKAMFMGVE